VRPGRLKGLPLCRVTQVKGASQFVPLDVVEEGADVCDYPMARDLIQFAVALASEAIVRFALQGERQSYSFTLQDLKIHVEG